jgi:cell wall integrity and stress response component
LTGFTRNHIGNLDPSSLTTTSKPTDNAKQTVVVTASASPKKSASTTAGIAVGVIVGLVILGGIIGGAFIFFRNKKRREEEESKRHGDVDAFVSGKTASRPGMWAQESRLDTAATDRRTSSGSLADNQDYSRRILQVRFFLSILVDT